MLELWWMRSTPLLPSLPGPLWPGVVAVFVDRPTQRASMAQGLFYGGSGRRAVAHTRPAFPKMPTAPSAFPWLGAPQAPGDEPSLLEGSKSLGGRPPEAEGNYPAAETHPARSAPLPARSAEVWPNNWRSTVLIQLQLRPGVVAPDGALSMG